MRVSYRFPIQGGMIWRTGALALAIAIAFALPIDVLAEEGSSVEATAPALEASEPNALVLSAQAEAIRDAVQALVNSAKSETDRERLKGVAAHYEAAAYAPIWLADGQPGKRAATMVAIMDRAHEDGLYAPDYDVEGLKTALADADTDPAGFEVRLSVAVLTFAQHMNAGRLDPRSVNREIVIYPQTLSAEKILSDLRTTSILAAYFRLLAPHTPRYERLRNALAVYRGIEQRGGWTEVPEGEVLKPGTEDERVPAIRRRMIEAGTYRGDASAGLVYDEALVEAVTLFQARGGLEQDGVIGPATLAEMNVSVQKRIATMVVNMERNRWMQNDFGENHIFANLADQVVKLVRAGDTVHAEVIQVGAPYHRTPVFTDEMEYVEINPYWNVPVSIAVNEYLPKLRRNPGVLGARNISLFSSGGGRISPASVNWSRYGKGNFPFRLRQEPGRGNALGRIKFMFPNPYNVYMHDTPSKSKFAAAQRYFSHGCLRLRDPLTMAEKILEVQGWDRARIDRVVASGKRTVVTLEENLPVHVVYLTSWVNKDGSVHFREDVYGRDAILAKALQRVRGG